MTTETILTDAEVAGILSKVYGYPAAEVHLSDRYAARAIEQAPLQSPEIQALRKDKERLDFIEAQYGADIVCFESGEWEISSNDIIGFGSDLRDTIDAAMEQKT